FHFPLFWSLATPNINEKKRPHTINTGTSIDTTHPRDASTSDKEEVGDDGNNKTNDTSNTNNSTAPYDKQEAQRMTSQDLNPD
ncbi:hypothetical protein PT043_08930, partial [Erysipelothrix rhusiopathiae]|nr:hypothetical protein [Erysipelothrix rhusiopathiae]